MIMTQKSPQSENHVQRFNPFEMGPQEPGRICSHSSSGILLSADISLKSPLKIDRLASKLCWLHAILVILIDFYLV